MTRATAIVEALADTFSDVLDRHVFSPGRRTIFRMVVRRLRQVHGHKAVDRALYLCARKDNAEYRRQRAEERELQRQRRATR
jgi:hypothetical protein